jgi:hypothetical protein
VINLSLTTTVRRRKHLAAGKVYGTNQSRFVPMNKIISAAIAPILMLGSASAREAVWSPIVPNHGANIAAERQVAQFASRGEGGVPCTTEYILTRDTRGWYLRKEVDCDE